VIAPSDGDRDDVSCTWNVCDRWCEF